MTDLIERLRKEDHGLSCECVDCYDIKCEAADELARLRAEVERLRESKVTEYQHRSLQADFHRQGKIIDKQETELLSLRAIAEAAVSKTWPRTHETVDAFWRIWAENGESGKHGVYESTWMAFDAALAEWKKNA